MAKSRIEKPPADLPGSVELLVLTAVSTLGDDANGVAVFDLIQENFAHMRLAFGSVYTALERMTWKGYLKDRMGPPDPARGGRARKYFRLTGLGEAVLNATTEGLAGVASRRRPASLAPSEHTGSI